jgi:hypothetical protein
MTLHELLHRLAQFQGWSGLGLGTLCKLCARRRAWECLAATVCVAMSPVFWFSTTVPCVMIRRSMFLSVASDR